MRHLIRFESYNFTKKMETIQILSQIFEKKSISIKKFM